MDELEQLKKVLRALVVSSPCQVDMFSLLRDYRQMMGGHLPTAKYGYREPLSFLKERFNDCFVFHGDPKNPTLTPIVTEELKHIDKFVQNQKKSAAVKYKGKRRSIEPRRPPPPQQQEPDLIVKTFNKFTIKNDHSTNNTSTIPESTVEDHSNNHQIQSSPEYTVRKSPEVTVQESPVVTVRKSPEVTVRRSPEITKVTKTQNNSLPKDDSSSNAVRSFLKKKTSLYNSQYFDGESSVNGKLLSDNDSGRQTSSSNSIKKSIALEQLKDEVVELVASSAEGVWCTDLLRLYRERHGRELNFGRFGFTSIISLVSVLDARLAIARPDATGDWLLRPAHAPPAPRPAPRPAHRPHRPACAVDPDDALPGIDFDPDVFPVDCMHFMESIPALSLAAIEPGALLEVMVGEVYSPSHFWLIRLGEQYHIAMEQIMDEMTEYYSMGEGKDRYLAMGAVRVGHYCSSVFDRDWHRSLIVKVIDSETVKVRHVDYGTVDRVCVRGLRPLRRCWGLLPAMAVRARLAGVRPGAAGRRWPRAACTRFLDTVRDTHFVASVVAVDREEDILEVFLVNTSTAEDEDVSADLIRSGHADPRRDSCVRSGECFLFPRFEALESGATPNYAEICDYLRDGISLDYVDDYRRHVPDCLPPQAPLAAPPDTKDDEPSPPPRPVTLVNRVPLFPTSIPILPSESEAAEFAEPERSNRSEPALSVPPTPSPSPPPAPAPLTLPAPAAPAPPAAEQTAPAGITLSASECETFQFLSRVDPAAAHWFMVGALGRAAPPAAPLNAAAPEFRPTSSSHFHPRASLPQFHPNTSAPQFHPNASAPQSHPNASAPQFHPNTSAPQFHPNASAPQSHPNTSAPQFHPNASAPQSHPNTSAPQSHPNASAPQSHPNTSAPQSHPNASAPQFRPNAAAPEFKPRPFVAPPQLRPFPQAFAPPRPALFAPRLQYVPAPYAPFAPPGSFLPPPGFGPG